MRELLPFYAVGLMVLATNVFRIALRSTTTGAFIAPELRIQFLRQRDGRSTMGWEFAAFWIDDSAGAWQWVWRRVADDNGHVIEESDPFAHLDLCLENAREHGFEDGEGNPGL